MDNINLILTGTVSPPSLLEQTKKFDGVSEEDKKQYAKDFESVFISKLLDEMKNTIVDWGEEKDSAAKQTEGIFWLYLARDIANNGGFGMWKDIYKSLNGPGHKNTTAGLVDKKI